MSKIVRSTSGNNFNLLPSKQASTMSKATGTNNTFRQMSFDSTLEESNQQQQQQSHIAALNLIAKNGTINSQLKKKRTALENISNGINSNNAAAGLISNANSGSITNLATKEVKKSRFGLTTTTLTALNTNAATASNNVVATSNGLKKSDTILNKKSALSSSKENLNNNLTTNPFGVARKAVSSGVIPANVKASSTTTSTGKNGESVSNKMPAPFIAGNLIQPQQPIQKQQSKSATSTLSQVKSEKTEIVKQEPLIKQTELHLERQLAHTCISSASSTSCSSVTTSTSSISMRTTESFEIKSEASSLDNVRPATDEINREKQPPVVDWVDIDADDVDEFNCADYVKQIFQYYREREAKFSVEDYISHQPQITKQMRLLLVDWMVEVQQQLEFNHEVLYLSVKLLDLYLNSRRIEKEKLQLLGGAAMFIACKFEERMPPIIDDFIYVSDNAYERKDLIKMEIEILKTIRFDIGAPLSYTFLRRYSKCVRADMRFLTLARYLLELSLQDYSFAYVRDSLKACAALYLALKMAVKYDKEVAGQNQEPSIVSTANLTSTEWNPTLVHFTGSTLDEFIHLVPQMNTLVQQAPNAKYKTIFKKYSHQVFYEVAKLSPLTAPELEVVLLNVNNVRPIRN